MFSSYEGAPDGWYAPRFLALFSALAVFRVQAFSPQPPVTQTVSLFRTQSGMTQ